MVMFVKSMKICNEDVVQAVKKFTPKQSVGLDGIPANIHKPCWKSFIYSLEVIFNLTLSKQRFPKMLKASKLSNF